VLARGVDLMQTRCVANAGDGESISYWMASSSRHASDDGERRVTVTTHSWRLTRSFEQRTGFG
jgi:hypothetical protein